MPSAAIWGMRNVDYLIRFALRQIVGHEKWPRHKTKVMFSEEHDSRAWRLTILDMNIAWSGILVDDELR